LSAGTASLGALTALNVTGTVDSDLIFSAFAGGVRKIRFAGVTDTGWIAYYVHDTSANNPWYSAGSTQNSVMEVGVGDDISIHADSVRIEGGMGIYLKAADRVISSAKIEARGGVDALGNSIATTGAIMCGSMSAGSGALVGGSAVIAGAVTARSVNAGAGAIQTTGSIPAGSSTLGAVTAQSVDEGSGTIRTTGPLEAGVSTLGATTTGALTATSIAAGSGSVTAGSFDAGTGAIVGGSATVGTLTATTSLSLPGTVSSDLTFASSAGPRRILFAGINDSAWVLYILHNSSDNNPWFNANATASTQNSVLEIGVGDEAGAHADSVRIDGCAGIYLKASDRVISSCKIEARGGIDALDKTIATTGAVTCGSLNATNFSAGTFSAGACTLGSVTASSVNAGSGAIQTTGSMACGTISAGSGAITTADTFSTGTLTATGSTTLAMTTITAPAVSQEFSVGTDLVYRGAPVSITGTTASASGL
jgi:hypothetical protein